MTNGLNWLPIDRSSFFKDILSLFFVLKKVEPTNLFNLAINSSNLTLQLVWFQLNPNSISWTELESCWSNWSDSSWTLDQLN